MSEHIRESDTVIHEVKLLIEEESKRNKEWQSKHDVDALQFRTEILGKIQPFDEFSRGLSIFWKILLSISALIVSGLKAWDWVKTHVR
jgi:hypothetical protein